MKRLLFQIPSTNHEFEQFGNSHHKNDQQRITSKILNFHVLLEKMLESKNAFELSQDLVLEKNYEDAQAIADRIMKIVLELPSINNKRQKMENEKARKPSQQELLIYYSNKVRESMSGGMK